MPDFAQDPSTVVLADGTVLTVSEAKRQNKEQERKRIEAEWEEQEEINLAKQEERIAALNALNLVGRTITQVELIIDGWTDELKITLDDGRVAKIEPTYSDSGLEIGLV